MDDDDTGLLLFLFQIYYVSVLNWFTLQNKTNIVVYNYNNTTSIPVK